MKMILLAALLVLTLSCFAQTTEKKLYIFRTKNDFGAKEAMQLVVNGRTIKLPKNTLISIPVTNDSIRIEYADRHYRRWSQPVLMGAQEENYFIALFSIKSRGWPQALILMQQVSKDCLELEQQRTKNYNVVSL